MHKQLFIIILTLVAVACGSQRQAVSDTPTVPENQRRLATYVFGEASKQYALGNHDAAYELLQHTLRLNPQHAPSLALLAQYEVFFRNIPAADSLLTMALELEPLNPDYLASYAYISDRLEDPTLSLRAYEKLATVRPRNVNVLSQLARLYMKAEMTDSALNTLSRIENIQGMSESLSNTKHLLLLSEGDTLGAMAELQRLCDEFPGDPNYTVTLANAYSRLMNDNDTARVLLDRVAVIDPTNARLQFARLNLYERTDTTLYNAYHDSLLYGHATDNELRRGLMLRFIQQHRSDSAGQAQTIAMFDSVLVQPQENANVLSTYVAYLMSINSGDSAVIPVLNRIIEVEPDNRAALIELLQRYGQGNNSDGVARVCDQAITYYPHEPLFYYYSCLGNFLRGDTLTALERVTVGCEHITEETSIETAADMYAMRGDILHGLGRIEESFAAYDSCLVYQPDNIGCLNNYAYFLSLEGRDLERAEQMSYRTVRAEPNNRTYLDTYAWILYLQGRYEEAATYMSRVMEGIDMDDTTTHGDLSEDVFRHAREIFKKVDKELKPIRNE